MAKGDEREIIETARRAFDANLHEAEFQAVLADDAELPWLVDALDPRPGGRYLDLATGNGYVALALATREPASEVTGVDIATAAIATNAEKAAASGLGNIRFEAIDGIGLPFDDGAFDGVTCRYALHHFPALDTTLAEVHRVIVPQGRLVCADALRHDADDVDFINRFQALQPDGHVCMHDREALLEICAAQGFALEASHLTAIAFPRPLDAALGALLAETAPEVLALYGIEVEGETIRARIKVLNARFRRCDRLS